MNQIAQKALSAEQIEAFYHDNFVDDQVRDFATLVPTVSPGRVVVDVGGGCGFFAKRLQDRLGHASRVIDMDPGSVDACARIGVAAMRGDALSPELLGDEEVACFNLILHHLVGDSEAETRELQISAIRAWRSHAKTVLVNEYIYGPYVANLSGWLIFQITNSAVLSWIGRQVARVVPAFKANTFGVGVRFRAHSEWRRLFATAGFRVAEATIGEPELISPPLRILLIKTIRRDSFRLEAIAR